MLSAALRVGIGVRHGQLEGTVGKMIGESRMPSFSHLRKWMGRLDVNIDQGVIASTFEWLPGDHI